MFTTPPASITSVALPNFAEFSTSSNRIYVNSVIFLGGRSLLTAEVGNGPGGEEEQARVFDSAVGGEGGDDGYGS